MDDGAPIRVVRHGNLSGPRVVLSHGNGFASDSYFPFWRHMLERFDLALYDVRNCGRNPFHAGEAHDYPRFVRDIAQVHGAIAKEWGQKTTIGVFHSMTAIAALLAIIDGVWHWDALVLFDPPVVPPEGNPHRGPLMSEGETLRTAALVRQNRFRDPDELADVFRWLHRFRRLRPGVAELNARSVLHFDRASGE
ncbi:MAG: alpha/beta fold hydrolase, partial [Acidobacteria bacterium]|nr:alpha/beta fold hydrolase [Acidobacteriota bacterium]